jgi:hypothetical protein
MRVQLQYRLSIQELSFQQWLAIVLLWRRFILWLYRDHPKQELLWIIRNGLQGEATFLSASSVTELLCIT